MAEGEIGHLVQDELTPLDRFTRTLTGGTSSAGRRSRSTSRTSFRAESDSPTPRKLGKKSPWDDSKLGRSRRSSSRGGSQEHGRCVLIFDWDDTLFPITWIRNDCGCDWRKSLDAQLDKRSERGKMVRKLLERFATHASALLREASKRHHVIIVTLAAPGWIANSMQQFCPSLKEVMDECSPKIIYAAEHAKEYAKHPSRKPMMAQEAFEFWTEVKAAAIRKELHSESVVFTDIVSVGDSQYERHGTKRVANEFRGTDDADKSRLYVKVLKSLSQPTIEEVIVQMKLFLRWLPFIINRDEDLDVEIHEADDDSLNDVDNLIRGKVCSCGVVLLPDDSCCPKCEMRRPTGPKVTEEPLSWLKLADLKDDRGVSSRNASAKCTQDEMHSEFLDMVVSESGPTPTVL